MSTNPSTVTGSLSNDNSTITIVLNYGTGNNVTRTFPAGTTIGDALNDRNVKAALGFGASVEGHIDGIPMRPETTLAPGDEVQVHDKACQKAAAKGAAIGREKVGRKSAAVKPAPAKAATKAPSNKAGNKGGSKK